jgi:ArsR family transcriptional regulator, arsenate/arsenite/antimonite-responsive transcriptional repressor
MSDIFDVLADGTRRQLLRTLRDRAGEVSVSELVEQLGISQPTVSKHLKVLRDHALVAVREEGQHRYYRLDAEPLAEVEEWLAPFAASPARAAVSQLAADGDGGAFTAWAGAEVGGRVGRAAAETAHQARAALEAAEEKLQGARRALTGRLPGRRGSR